MIDRLLPLTLLDLARIEQNGSGSANRNARAKSIAASAPEVIELITARMSRGCKLAGVACVNLPDSENDLGVTFRFGAAEDQNADDERDAFVAVIDLTIGRVKNIADPDPYFYPTPLSESTFAPVGPLPFSLAAPSEVPHIVVPAAELRARTEKQQHFEQSVQDAQIRPDWNKKDAVVVMVAPANDLPSMAVARHVAELGGHPVVCDTAEYPTRIKLSVDWAGSGHQYQLTIKGETFTSADITGIWWRYGRPYGFDPLSSNRVTAFCRTEAAAAFEGWLDTVDGLVMNARRHEQASLRKPYQLSCAVAVGLTIPKTSITNDAGHALELAGDAKPWIHKALIGAPWSMLETRRLDERQLESLRDLRLAPAIFQEQVIHKEDIRAFVIDSTVAAIKIRSNRSWAQLDSRMDPGRDISAHELPRAYSEKLIELCERLGLRFAAIDLALTDAGYVFFEVNPRGTFLYGESLAGLPLSRTIAESLLARPTNRAS